MGTPDLTGIETAQRNLLLDVDIRGKMLANFNWEKHWTEFGYFRTEAFAGLVKAISRGDPAIENSLLRVWGIR